MKSERKGKFGKALALAVLFSMLALTVSTGCVSAAAPLTDTVFTDVASEYGVDDSRRGDSAVWFDYDNDGDLAILITPDATAGGDIYTALYRNDGDIFVDVADEVGLLGLWSKLSVGDYDNDGDIVILYARLFRNDINETGNFTAVGGYGQTFVDHDNDGDLDTYSALFWGSNKLFRNDGEARFVEIPGALGLDDPSHSRTSVWGDYDDDGDMDVYLVNGRGEKCLLYRNDVDTTGLFTDVTDEMGVGDAERYANGASWADYDNDGDLDLYVTSRDGCPNRLYRNEVSEGNGFVETGEMQDLHGRGMGGSWGDFDGDGDLDYYLVSGYYGTVPNRLYLNNCSENGNHWLHIKAIFGSQNSLPVEFGLGAHSTVDSVIIKWPNGIVQILIDVEVNQFLTVYEYTPGCIRQIPQESTISTNLEELFQLKINQIASIDSDNLKIKFLNITEDSRCPSDVVCFWEGQATIVVNTLKNDQDLGDFSLTSRAGHEDLAVKNFDRYSIKLKKVEPYPKTTQKIELSDYIVTLIVSKI